MSIFALFTLKFKHKFWSIDDSPGIRTRYRSGRLKLIHWAIEVTWNCLFFAPLDSSLQIFHHFYSFSSRQLAIDKLDRWWSSGHRARILLWRHELKPRWSTKFFLYKRTKINKKRPGLVHFLKKVIPSKSFFIFCCNNSNVEIYSCLTDTKLHASYNSLELFLSINKM